MPLTPSLNSIASRREKKVLEEEEGGDPGSTLPKIPPALNGPRALISGYDSVRLASCVMPLGSHAPRGGELVMALDSGPEGS